jgi:multisubunit Na+/H+ antiporter MnhC subunit
MQTNARRFLEDYDPVVPVLVLLAIVMESASLYIMWS